MGKYIIKLHDKGRNYYLEWSTIVDAPVTQGMSLAEFKKHYENEHGPYALAALPSRLRRVNATGCSAPGETLDSLLQGNHAGDHERTLTKQEIIEKYCRR